MAPLVQKANVRNITILVIQKYIDVFQRCIVQCTHDINGQNMYKLINLIINLCSVFNLYL